jgi:hypothetical protein
MRSDLAKTASAALFAALLAALPAPAQQTGAAGSQPPPAGAQQAAPAQPAAPCAGPEMREFAFWVGEWDLVSRVRQDPAKDAWTKEKGTDSIRPILNGCALLQEWRGTVAGQPLHGMSFTSYVPGAGEWQQAWVDDSGPNMYFFRGKMQDGRMVLTREVTVDGKTAYRRQVYSNIKPDSLDWSYEHSADGKTWTPVWTIRYTRRR